MVEQSRKYWLSHLVVRLVVAINFAHLLLMYYQPYFRAARNIFHRGGDVYAMMISSLLLPLYVGFETWWMSKEASYTGCGCAGGEVVTLTDEGTMDAGILKRRQQKIYSDVLGRTIKTEMLNWQGGSVYSTTMNNYNARNQVTLVRQYQGADTSSVYQDTTMTYDGYGRLKTRHVPEQDANTATTYNYNPDDTASSVVDARGASQTLTYNNRHLVTHIAYAAPAGIPTTPNVSFAYDAAGNRTSMTDGMGGVSYEYNQLSRMTSEARTFSDASNSSINGVTKTIANDYNLAGEMKSITDPAGATINYAFDATGRLGAVTGSSFGGVTTYASAAQYRASGALKHLNYGNTKTLDATYNARLQASSFNIPGVMSKTYDYYADGQLRFSSDLRDHRFDRFYSHDHQGRLKEALSGAEARGQAATNDRPYKETFAYDGFSHLTNRTSNNWSDYYTMPPDSYTNNRRDGWDYDAEGNLFASVDATYSYDAAGAIRTVGTYEPQSTTTRGLDGDGQQLRTVESTYKESSQTWDTTTTYYLHSTVLGGQVLTELGADGAKTRTFVYAGGTVLAWQKFYGPYPGVEWEHRDASNASFGTTDITGAGSVSAELDPIGADAGTHAPLIQPNPPNDSGTSLLPYPSFMDAHSGLTRTYRTDGITVSVDYFMQALDSRFHGSSLQLAEYISQASAPRLRNYEVARYRGRLLRDFGLNENRAIAEALETNSTLIRNWVVNDNWSAGFALLPQNTSGQSDLASLISQTRDIIKNASGDCAKLLGKEALSRFDAISGNIQFNGDILVHVEGLGGGVREGRLSDVPPTSAVTVGDQIYLNPSGYAFGTFHNFPALDKYFAKIGTSSQHEFALATILHEFLHTTGRFKPDSKVGLDGKIDSKQSEKYQKEVLKKCFPKK